MKDIGNWRGLCTNLRVDEGIMDRLINSADHDEAKKLECLTAYWNGGKATWTEVIQAVAMTPINNKRIANDIAKKYGVDFDEVKDEF